MIDIIKGWFQRYFSDPEAVVLAILLIVGFTLILTWGLTLAPLIASIVIAYLLQWMVNTLTKRKIPKLLGVFFVYIGFFSLFFVALLVLWPIAWEQMVALVHRLPEMLEQAKLQLYLLPESFPEYISKETVDVVMADMTTKTRLVGQLLLTATISSIPGLIAIAIYLVLVPLLVFFFLKDHEKIVDWCANFLPTKRPILKQVWEEVDLQIGNYVRGKFAEVMIVGVATYFVFIWLKMPYALLLAVLVGLSVFVPYIGAMLVTIPVLLIAYFEWGLEAEFVWVSVSYFIIQILDGNVLVPLLFSEAVNLHPVAIIVAILVFGGMWGIWGVFFAIPLATLVKAVLTAWPRHGIQTDGFVKA